MFPQQDIYGREIIVEELVLFQTGTYNDQFRRDYRVNGGNQNGYMNAMDKLNEVTRDGTNLNATAIAQAGLTIIAPATEATPQSITSSSPQSIPSLLRRFINQPVPLSPCVAVSVP